MSDPIKITISVDPDEAADMTYGQRERFLGKLAEAQLARTIPPRPPLNGGSKANRWKPYTRTSLAQAFEEWARLHDGRAPTKRDWSLDRDPDSQWPRPTGESFSRAVKSIAFEDGVNLSTSAPHAYDPEHLARRAWHEAQSVRLSTDGLIERTQHNPYVGSRIGEIIERWEPTADEQEVVDTALSSPDPGPYCEECFHGSGCKPPEMSVWRYAVEVIGGLSVRTGGDSHATRSARDQFGRNRQMVTGGSRPPGVIDVDASLDRYIR